MEIVGLKAIHDRRALAHRAAREAQQRGRARRIFVGGEGRVRALRGVARHFLHAAAEAEQQRIERMAAGGEQGAAAEFAFCVPAVLAVPRADAVKVVDLAVMQRADEARIEHRFRGEKLRRPPALEAHAHFHARLLRRALHREDVAPLDRQRLLHDDVLARARRRDELRGVLIRVAGDVHDVDRRIGEHRREVCVGLDRRAMLRAQLRGIERTRRPDRRDLRAGAGVDCGDVGGGGPAVADDRDVIFFAHGGWVVK